MRLLDECCPFVGRVRAREWRPPIVALCPEGGRFARPSASPSRRPRRHSRGIPWRGLDCDDRCSRPFKRISDGGDRQLLQLERRHMLRRLQPRGSRSSQDHDGRPLLQPLHALRHPAPRGGKILSMRSAAARFRSLDRAARRGDRRPVWDVDSERELPTATRSDDD